MTATHSPSTPQPTSQHRSARAPARAAGAKTSSSQRQRRGRSAPSAWGTVQQLPSGRWRAFFRHEGQRIAAPTTFDTKASAQGWLSTQHADIVRGAWINPALGRVSLTEYADYWLETRADLAPRTRQLYQGYLRRWILAPVTGSAGRTVELGSKTLTQITPVVIRAWHGALLHATAVSANQRKPGGTVTPEAPRPLYGRASRRPHPARVWARSQGIDVPQSGRLSPALLDAWAKAGATDAATKAQPKQLDPRAGRSTTAKAYALLRTILNAATADGIINQNPCKIPGAGQDHTPERPIATPAEVTAIAQAFPAHLAAAVMLAAWGALRYGELFALARKHIDLDSGTVKIQRTLLWLEGQSEPEFTVPKTRKSARTVHLPPFVLELLAEHLQEYTPKDPEALVFTTTTGTAVTRSRLTVHMRAARESINRPDLHWHDLRHTGATLAYRAGASVPQVQARLGHTTMRAASIYAHAADDSDQRLAGRLHEMFNSPPSK